MRTQLKEGERLIIEVRKHWIVLSKPFIATACMIFVLQNLSKYNLLGLKETLHKAGLCGIIICALYLIYVWLDRKYDIWAVTNQRVIDESGVVTHKAKESPLEKINNIDVVQTLSGRLMGYGRVQIQTAALEGESWIDFVEKPEALRDAIIRERENLKVQPAQAEGHRTGADTAGEVRETRECPFCAEIILKKARICRFCGREIPEGKTPVIIETLQEKTLQEETLQEKTTPEETPFSEARDEAPLGETPSANAPAYRNPHSWKQKAARG